MLRMIKGRPAALLEDEKRILLVADLHLGFEHELQAAGINVPPQSEKIFQRLAEIIDHEKPEAIYVLGDLKHQVLRISPVEWEDVPLFLREASQRVKEIHLVHGNHDGGIEHMLSRSVFTHSSKGVVIEGNGRFALVHGHAWPSINALAADTIIMGHIHPVVEFETKLGFTVRRRIWLKQKCNRKALARAMTKSEKSRAKALAITDEKGAEITLIVMPAFNDFLSGVSVNASPEKRLLGPILRSGSIDPGHGEVFLLDGTYLGKIAQLRHSQTNLQPSKGMSSYDTTQRGQEYR